LQTSPGYGWSTKFNDALADDLLWVATGSSPVAGTYEGKGVYLEKIIKRLGDRPQSWPKPVVENIVVDGDTACVQFHGEGRAAPTSICNIAGSSGSVMGSSRM
jgi:uncharacterized protein